MSPSKDSWKGRLDDIIANLRKPILNLTVLLIAASPSGLSGFKEYGILTEDDWRLERVDRLNGPALSSALDAEVQWKSYNQWLCFPRSAVEVTRAEIIYDGERKYLPQISAWIGNHLLEVSISAESRFDFDRLERKWKAMVNQSSHTCVYAAYLQPLDAIDPEKSVSLWTIARIKTETEYWIEEQESSID